MSCRPSATAIVAFGVVLAAVSASPAFAQTAANVMVVINEASPESVRIGEYYVAKRDIPPENVTRLKTAVADELDRAAYEFSIERPISETLTRHATQDRIHYIVLTKGIPLRVRGTGGLDGSTASVDSELTLLYRKLLGIPIPPAGRVPNPYYLGDRLPSEAQRFEHRTHDIYLVTRLDGFTVDDVIKLIDRGAAPQREGVFVLDQRAVLIGNRVGDDWLNSAAERLATDGLGARVQLERSKSPATAAQPGARLLLVGFERCVGFEPPRRCDVRAGRPGGHVRQHGRAHVQGAAGRAGTSENGDKSRATSKDRRSR